MNKRNIYSVSELSELAGVSKRTLHHYDEIGLLVPLRHADNKYREYHQHHVNSLKQILIYKALGFGIEDIKELLKSESGDVIKAFGRQKSLLSERQEEIASMIKNLDEAIVLFKGDKNSEILFDGIPKENQDRWTNMFEDQADEATFSNYSRWKSELEVDEAGALKGEIDEFIVAYIAVLGLRIDTIKVQELVRQHYISSNHTLYEIHEGFKGIGYEGFSLMAKEMQTKKLNIEIYDHYREGLAKHLGMAMAYFAENTLKHQLAELRVMGSDSR